MIRVLDNQMGAALLLVLWVLVILSVVAGSFCRVMRTDVNMTRNDKDTTQAYYAAVGGFNMALSKILDRLYLPSVPDSTTEDDDTDIANWRINVDLPTIAVGEEIVQVRIENESGKVNINLADQALLKQMLSGFELSEAEQSVVVSSIMDWRDPDDLHRLNGAENDYYQSLPEPYTCKNGDFDTIEELLRVRGVTPQIFYKGLRKMVTVIPDQATAREIMHWIPNQPVQLNQLNKNQAKRNTYDFNKININAASPEMLMALPGFTAETVDAVLAFRAEKDIRNAGELAELIGAKAYSKSFRSLTFNLSPFYRISSFNQADEHRGSRGVSAVVYIDTKSQEPYLILQWLDYAQPTGLQ